MMKSKAVGRPDDIRFYLLTSKGLLAIVTFTGLIYNLGLTAGPWLEGKLVQCLLDIFNGTANFRDMLRFALFYAGAITIVQIARYYKRLYVRRLANRLNLQMKHTLYRNLVYKEKTELDRDQAGSLMTKAISDVEASVEGIRKFITEIFDTGVAMLGYYVFLLFYDWRLTLLCMLFPPISYYLAEKMKTVVQRTGTEYKESSGHLNSSALDRIKGAITYRIHGCEEARNAEFENSLNEYENKAVASNIWVSSMEPLYRIIAQAGVLFILYFGVRNVQGTGWVSWDIAAFTAFLSCYAKLAVKTSHAAKLFNAVHKAQVSWKRIKPLMKSIDTVPQLSGAKVETIKALNLGFAYSGHKPVFDALSFEVTAGQIIGITGPVACGKSTLGKIFLNESPYRGSLQLDGRELSEIPREEQKSFIGYLGHNPEILNADISDNILMGLHADPLPYLEAVCLNQEVAAMPDGMSTLVGSGGIRLSGGQQQRLALARVLAHDCPVLVLDDPFSALDRTTEIQCFINLKKLCSEKTIFLMSHRLYLFPQLDQVIWMEDGHCTVSKHSRLMKCNDTYAELYRAQAKEEKLNEYGA